MWFSLRHDFNIGLFHIGHPVRGALTTEEVMLYAPMPSVFLLLVKETGDSAHAKPCPKCLLVLYALIRRVVEMVL